MIVKLTKISGKPDSHIKPGYIVEGHCSVYPEVGKRCELSGFISTSEVEHFNWFHTTEVLDVMEVNKELIFTTKNSTWKLSKINKS